jgi:hypothetical protein
MLKRIVFLAAFAWSSAVQAQEVQCGPQPTVKDMPPDVQQKVMGDLEGKAQIFSKLFGDADIKRQSGDQPERDLSKIS